MRITRAHGSGEACAVDGHNSDTVKRPDSCSCAAMRQVSNPGSTRAALKTGLWLALSSLPVQHSKSGQRAHQMSA